MFGKAGRGIRSQGFSRLSGEVLLRFHLLAQEKLGTGLIAQLLEHFRDFQGYFSFDDFFFEFGSLFIVQGDTDLRRDVFDALEHN